MHKPTENLSVEHYTKPQQAQRATTGDLSESDKELVNYIFFKMRETWGERLYEVHVGDEGSLRIKKRDWAKDLLTALNCKRQNVETEGEWLFRAKDKIDRVFSQIRMHVDDGKKTWEFPSLRRVCSEMAHYVIQPAHKYFDRSKAIEDKTRAEAARSVGEVELAKMRESLGIGS